MVNIIKLFRPAYCLDNKPSRVVYIWCLLIIALFYLTAAINAANAATYYLDANSGNDTTGDGSSGSPWQSVAKAQAVVQGGDTVILRSGNYGPFEQVDFSYTDWVIYRAATGATPVFSKIYIKNNVKKEVYLRFDEIAVRVPMPSGISPDDPPWDMTANPVWIKRANYIQIENSKLAGANKYLTMNGVYAEESSNLTVRRSEITDVIRGMSTKSCDNLLVSYNHFHKLGGSSGIRPGGTQDTRGTVIEGNHLYDNHYNFTDDYCPPDTLRVDLSYDLSGLQIGEEVYQPAVEKARGIIMAVKGEADYQVVYLRPLIKAEGFVANEECVAQISGVTFTPYTTGGFHAGNGIALWIPNDVIIRNNIVHDGFNQGLMTYLTEHSNITLENNLFYDVVGTSFGYINGPLVVRNNTFIGNLNNIGLHKYDILGRHTGPLSITFKSGFDGAGVEVYNNIVVGSYSLPAPDDEGRNNYEEDYNIWWRRLYRDVNGSWRYSDSGKGNRTFIALWHEDSTFHGWPNFFEDIGFTDSTPEYDYLADGIQPFFVNPSFAFEPPFLEGCGYTWDYHLAAGSPSINFGDPANQPSDSLGTIGPDGFIRNDGPPRDASHHSAGCYEYSPIDPNNPTPVLQAIGDKFMDENVALTFTVNATDPNGEPITYSAQGLPSGATLDPLTGEFAWTPSYNQAGIYHVTFRASDGNSWDSETITITVNNVNRPPVLGAITDQSVNENALLSIPVNASDPDGQALTYSVSGLPAGAVFASQTLTWTPSYDQAGAFPVTFTADDGQAQDSQAITITVINVNRTPVLAAINNQSVWADDPLTFTIDATDPDGDAVTYSAGALPTGATFIGQDFDWTPDTSQMGSYDVTFIASDGQLQDSQMVTITVDVDSLAPNVTNSLPAAGSIQAPLNNLINLNITDAGKGVDADSVTIEVNNNTVYTGDTNHYSSPDGECRRLGNKADYRFVYQSNEEFDYDQTVSITVNATDLAGNVMSGHSYSFVTEMRSFGQNNQVNSGSVNLHSDRPVTVRDSSGNIWAAWHAGPIDNRDIYIGKLAAGADDFGSTVQLTNDANDQCNPAVALDSSDKLYVVWQDNREGDWDIYVSTSVDRISWSTETRVNDPNDGEQVNPAIAIDGLSANQAHVVWQDDRAGNQDICIATSSDGFATKTVSQITSDTFDQVEPAITADSANTIYVVWTDGRNGPYDIYGAASNTGPWTNVAIVSNANNQSSPAIAAEGAGSILHLLWADDTSGDNDIYYASSNGLLDCPLTGFSIIDDTSAADQLEPAIAIEGSIGNDLKVFACWQDWRNTDADLYFAELSAGSGTNVFVGDGGSSAYQGEPAIGTDEYDHPYLVWADSRNSDIYYAGSTFVEPVPLISELAPFSNGAVYGLPVGQLRNPGDICMQIPGGAYSHEMKLKASRIKNARRFTSRQSKIPFEFSPSGIEFNVPITITIAYEPVGTPVSVYWHDPLTETLSQDGITNVTIIEKSPTLHLVRFKVRHFTAFYLIGGGAAAIAGGGGGGGCSVCSRGEGNIVEFILPYIGLAVLMVILKVRDSRRRKARNIAAGK